MAGATHLGIADIVDPIRAREVDVIVVEGAALVPSHHMTHQYVSRYHPRLGPQHTDPVVPISAAVVEGELDALVAPYARSVPDSA
eukprot:420250-Rhodomonas_salina.2